MQSVTSNQTCGEEQSFTKSCAGSQSFTKSCGVQRYFSLADFVSIKASDFRNQLVECEFVTYEQMEHISDEDLQEAVESSGVLQNYSFTDVWENSTEVLFDVLEELDLPEDDEDKGVSGSRKPCDVPELDDTSNLLKSESEGDYVKTSSGWVKSAALDAARVIQRAWRKYSFVVLKCDECGKRKNELKDASLIKGIGCGVYLCTNCMDFECECCKCMRARPCECGRAECDVVGGTCIWMNNQYDKYNSRQPPTPEVSWEESMEGVRELLLMSVKRRKEIANAHTRRIITVNASVTIQRAWRKYSLQKPVEPPLVKVSKEEAEPVTQKNYMGYAISNLAEYMDCAERHHFSEWTMENKPFYKPEDMLECDHCYVYCMIVEQGGDLKEAYEIYKLRASQYGWCDSCDDPPEWYCESDAECDEP